MKITDVGEFGIVNEISKKFLVPHEPGLVGIGDDCAVIPWKNGVSKVVTTDLLIEDTHFLRSKILPEELAHKAMVANLSDIASMGARPQFAFLSLALPKDLEMSWLDSFLTGFERLASQTGTLLLGGDTTRSSSSIVVNVCLIGECNTQNLKLRSAAHVGDVICVTGYLGDSYAGLMTLLEELGTPEDHDITLLRQRHHRPETPTLEGQWLGSQAQVHAMIDVSDGLNSDLRHIMESSKVGVTIDLECLPVSRELRRLGDKLGWKVEEIAAIGGEDYCLLATIDQNHFQTISDLFFEVFKKPLFAVGLVTSEQNTLKYFQRGIPVELKRQGFLHFSST